MGYDTYGGGELIAVPALPDSFTKWWDHSEYDNKIMSAETVRNETVGVLPDGSIGVVGDSKTVFSMPDEDFRGELAEEVQKIADGCKKHKALLNGRLQMQGEEHSDVWRIVVVDNEVDEQHPELVWPDGTKGW